MKPEQIAQINVFNWIIKNNLHKYFIHIGNERICSPMEGRILKRMGIRKGASDIFLAIPKNGYHGLWIELKTGNNQLTDEQREFLDLMTEQGYMAICAWGHESAILFIEDYLKEKSSS